MNCLSLASHVNKTTQSATKRQRIVTPTQAAVRPSRHSIHCSFEGEREGGEGGQGELITGMLQGCEVTVVPLEAP